MRTGSLRIIYSPRYNISGYGIEKLHPFDGRKYARAWKAIVEATPVASKLLITPRRGVARKALERIHASNYLAKLKNSDFLAQVFETPQAARVPALILDWIVLRPMRFATQGTILAAQEALTHGLAVNLGGGYHHAKPDHGEGFNVFNDVAIAVGELRTTGKLGAEDAILYVDADAHQANGVCHCFLNDRSMKIFDVFNNQIYPQADFLARQRIDRPVPVSIGTDGETYLLELERALPEWLDDQCRTTTPRIAFYNAGTDVSAGDRLGALDLLPQHILERDVFVIESLRSRGVPTVMVLGGGYTSESYRLVADSVIALAKRFS